MRTTYSALVWVICMIGCIYSIRLIGRNSRTFQYSFYRDRPPYIPPVFYIFLNLLTYYKLNMYWFFRAGRLLY